MSAFEASLLVLLALICFPGDNCGLMSTSYSLIRKEFLLRELRNKDQKYVHSNGRLKIEEIYWVLCFTRSVCLLKSFCRPTFIFLFPGAPQHCPSLFTVSVVRALSLSWAHVAGNLCWAFTTPMSAVLLSKPESLQVRIAIDNCYLNSAAAHRNTDLEDFTCLYKYVLMSCFKCQQLIKVYEILKSHCFLSICTFNFVQYIVNTWKSGVTRKA